MASWSVNGRCGPRMQNPGNDTFDARCHRAHQLRHAFDFAVSGGRCQWIRRTETVFDNRANIGRHMAIDCTRTGQQQAPCAAMKGKLQYMLCTGKRIHEQSRFASGELRGRRGGQMEDVVITTTGTGRLRSRQRANRIPVARRGAAWRGKRDWLATQNGGGNANAEAVVCCGQLLQAAISPRNRCRR